MYFRFQETVSLGMIYTASHVNVLRFTARNCQEASLLRNNELSLGLIFLFRQKTKKTQFYPEDKLKNNSYSNLKKLNNCSLKSNFCSKIKHSIANLKTASYILHFSRFFLLRGLLEHNNQIVSWVYLNFCFVECFSKFGNCFWIV